MEAPSLERWDRAKCPSCQQFKIAPGTTPCGFCGGSGDLLLRMHEYENDHFARLHPQPRPLSFDGQLPVVSARVEEIAEEGICQRCKGHWAKCPDCSGTGRIVRPTAWVRNLPVWYEVTVEGVEPYHHRDTWYFSRASWGTADALPEAIFRLLPDFGLSADGESMRGFSSPAAARQALIAAVRRWRYSPRVDLT